jgi:hypothetical protein
MLQGLLERIDGTLLFFLSALAALGALAPLLLLHLLKDLLGHAHDSAYAEHLPTPDFCFASLGGARAWFDPGA